MIAIKTGVRTRGIGCEILLAVVVAHELFRERGESLTITSCTDGVHKERSLHYTGCAVDLRLPAVGKEAMVDALRSRLGVDYDVVLEKDHIHLEYDPKRA